MPCLGLSGSLFSSIKILYFQYIGKTKWQPRLPLKTKPIDFGRIQTHLVLQIFTKVRLQTRSCFSTSADVQNYNFLNLTAHLNAILECVNPKYKKSLKCS